MVEAEDYENDGAGGELHALFLLALDLHGALIRREGQEDEGDADDGDEHGAEDEDGGEGQGFCGNKAYREEAAGTARWNGELSEYVRYSALFLEYLHAAGRDANVQEAVGRACDDAEYVGHHIVVREAHCSEEHEVACAAYSAGTRRPKRSEMGPAKG